MTTEDVPDDDAALDAALRELPEPELPEALRSRLAAIPERSNVRRFSLRKLGVPAFGWAAAAAVGLFIGAQSLDVEGTAEGAPVASVEATQGAGTSDEDATLELAVGSFAEFGEEP